MKNLARNHDSLRDKRHIHIQCALNEASGRPHINQRTINKLQGSQVLDKLGFSDNYFESL